MYIYTSQKTLLLKSSIVKLTKCQLNLTVPAEFNSSRCIDLTEKQKTTMLQRLLRPQNIRLPLPCCVGNQRHHASVSAKEPAKTAAKEPAVDVSFTDWRPIYHLPLIRLVAAFNKLKIYQAAATIAATPLAIGLEQAGHVPGDVLGVCAAIGVSGLITLTLSSIAAMNVVGFIYINDEENKLKLAYVDFWGRRKEIQADIDDLLPDWEMKRTQRFGFYQPLHFRSDQKQSYKLLLRFGVVTDPLVFEGLFGQ